MCGFCIQVKFYGEESDVIIIRAAKETVKEVWTALSLITLIGTNSVVINVIHVFGTRSSLGSNSYLVCYDSRVLANIVQKSSPNFTPKRK